MIMKSAAKTLLKIIHVYDGAESTRNLISHPWVGVTTTYNKLLSHADELGLEVGMLPEDSKLMLNITIKI